MSIDLRLNANPGELGGTGKSAWVQLTDSSGASIALPDGSTVVDAAVPIAGVRGGKLRHVRVGHRGGLALNRVSSPVFQETGDGAAVNTQIWAQVATTQTATLANRITTLNAGNSVATSTGITHRSLGRFVKQRESLLRLSVRLRLSWQNAGTEMQVGFGTETSAILATPVDGVVMRVTPAGALFLSLYQNSTLNNDVAVVDIATGLAASMADAGGTVAPAAYYEVDLYVGDDSCHLVMTDGTDSFEADLQFGPGQAALSTVRALPVIIRTVNTSGTSLVNQLLYSTVDVITQDSDLTRPYNHSLALCNRNLLITPAGAPAQLANYANSAAPASATLSNTAAGYTTLGGQFVFAAVAGAETDYALFAYTVPLGYRAIVTGVRVSAAVMGAAIATTPTLMQWSIGRASAVTLAANSFRSTLGFQGFAVGSAIGTVATDLVHSFNSPFVAEGGQILHLILKMPVATATASQTIRGTVLFEGVLE